jgi:hypothetical protein
LNTVSFFNADYRDGRVHIGGKVYPSGIFATHLLNQYYENDTAARIGVFKQYILAVQRELEQGYINPSEFIRCSDDICSILKTLTTLKPFSMLDIDNERNRVKALFTEDNAEIIADYLRRRAKVANMDMGAIVLGVLPKEYDKEIFAVSETLISDIKKTLTFYDTISEDMIKAFSQLVKFTSRVDEAIRFNEAHLLPIAMEVFGQATFPIKTEYVYIHKTKSSKTPVTARRLILKAITASLLPTFLKDYIAGIIQGNVRYVKSIFLCSPPQDRNIAVGMRRLR